MVTARPEPSSRRFPRHLLLLVLLSALLVVFCLPELFWSLPEPGSVHTKAIDEGTPLVMFSQMQPRSFDFNPHYQVTGALGYYIMAGFVGAGGVLGAYPFETDINFYREHLPHLARIYLAGRISSLVFGIGLIWVMYGLGAALVNRKTGLFAAALVVFSPGIISNSATMTHNITVTFFTLLTVLMATRYVQKPTTRGFVLMSIMAGLGVSVKFSALPAMAVIPVAVLAADGLRPVTSRLMKMVAGGLLSILAFVVTSPYYLPGMLEGSQGYGGMKSTDVFSIATNWESSGGLLPIILSLPGRLTGILVSELGLLQVLLAAVGLVGLFVLGRRRPHFLPYLSVLVAFVVMFMFVDPYYIKRVRILPFFPFIILAAGYGLARVQQILKPSRGATFGFLALLFVWQGLLVASVMAAYRAPEVQDVSNEWMLQNIDQSSSIGMLDPPGWRHPSYLAYDWSLLDGEHPKESRQTAYRLVIFSTPDSLVDARPDWIILRRPWPSEFTATGRDSLYELVREFEVDVPRFERPLSLVWNPYLLFETHLYFLRRKLVVD